MDAIINELAKMLQTANSLTPEIKVAVTQILQYVKFSSIFWLVLSVIVIVIGILGIIAYHVTNADECVLNIGIILIVTGILFAIPATLKLIQVIIAPYGLILKMLIGG